MGNTASSSGKNAHGHNIRDETVDFGHLSPQGIYTGPQDWNQQVVGKLIVDRKLAPFYRPLEDYESDWDDETILRNRKLKPGEEALPPPVTMSVSGPTPLSGKISGKGKGVADRRESARMSEAEVYHGATECPICFMYYPPNMNRSRCCDQAICTECFVQIKRAEPTTTHLVSESAACPYCVQENFGVTYEPPSWRAGLVMNTSGSSRPEMSRLGGSAMSTDSQGPLASERTRRKSVPYQAGEVVTVDLIRPDWEAKLEAVRAAVTRRANRRIVMRQVGDRLIPVGITSGRVVPVNIAGGEADGSGGRRSRRQRNGHGSGDLPMGMSGHDLEELMMMEAMRLSLLEHEAQQQRQASARNTASNPDAASPRETSNASPDPASQLSQDDLPQSSHDTEPEPSFSTTVTDPASSSGANTPLNANHSRILAAASDHSSTVSPRASFDASQATPPFHNRSGSGPLHIASSPLNGAAGLAMAVGLPAPNESSNLGETSQAGIPPRTLDTISAAVGASTFPAVILGSGMDNLSVLNSSAISQEGGKARQVDPSTETPFVSTMAPSIEREESLSAGQASPPVEGDSTGNTAQSSHEKSVDAPHAKSAGASGSELPDPFGLGFTLDGASAHSPIASQIPGIQHEPSAAFLTTAARTMTNSSIVTADSQQSKGENYDVLLSSPETETDEPLMSGPPNLARLNTMDSYSGASGSN